MKRLRVLKNYRMDINLYNKEEIAMLREHVAHVIKEMTNNSDLILLIEYRYAHPNPQIDVFTNQRLFIALCDSNQKIISSKELMQPNENDDYYEEKPLFEYDYKLMELFPEELDERVYYCISSDHTISFDKNMNPIYTQK